MGTELQLTFKFSELATVSEQIKKCLSDSERFCLWLQGELGAGKTTLAGNLLHRFGLSPHIPVTSPTYTYMNEFKIDGEWFAHMDLYRAPPYFAPEDLGMLDTRPWRGIMVEWPEKVADNPYLQPTHILRLEFGVQSDERLLQLHATS